MAENETLDLMHRNSGRWRQLCKRVAAAESDDRITGMAVGCLYKTFQKVCQLIALDDLLSAAAGKDGHIWDIVRGCREGRDYAELFALEAKQGLDRQTIAENVVWATVYKFLDQIKMSVVPSETWPSFRSLEEHCYQSLKQSLGPRIRRLAQQIAQNPGKAPRMPPVSKDAKEKQHKSLLSTSLLNR
jgi:hypothetical protein